MRHFSFSLFLILVLVMSIPISVNAQTFTVSDIRLEGLQRISANSVFGLLNINVGDEITEQDISEIIRDVFASENFDEIEVLREDNVLIIRVQERPSISNIEIEGNKMMQTEQLLENMANAGLDIGQVFNASTLEGLSQSLQEQYIGQGLYGASIDIEVIPQERNRVALNININEGDASKIVHINIVGNTVFEEEELLDLFELRTTHLTSFFRKDDRYAKEKINGDLERLTSYYMDQGYINFDITSTQVSLTPDKSEVYITVNIFEGDIYRVNEVELAGNLVDSEVLLRLILQVRKGQIFSQQLVTVSAEFMTQLLTNRGYFYAEVEGVSSLNEDDRTVDIIFFVNPGSRTYINRISFLGNTNTVDEVLRREMRQMEGAPASNLALEQSKVRLQRLGFFREVEYETDQVPGTSDQIDVEFSVEEQASGSIGGSIGFSQIQGLVFGANLQQNNFLGTGKRVGISANTSRFSTNYSYTYFDPYYTLDGVSRGFSIGFSKSDFAELNLAAFSTNQFNANVNYGYQLSETQSIGFNFGYTKTEIDIGFGPVQEIKTTELLPGIDNYLATPPRGFSFYNPDTGQIFPIADGLTVPILELPASAFSPDIGFVDREGDNFDNFTLTTSWSESTLNQGLFPTAGSAQSLSFEFTVPGSDLEYYRIRYFNERYIPIFREWIIHFRTDLGFGDGYGGTEQLPFFQNFTAGGRGTVRGFERNTLGPRATNPERYLAVPTTFLKDENGNIRLDLAGFPLLDDLGELAYQLVQVVGADGELVFDETGQPVLEQKLNKTLLFIGRPSPFGGNIQATGTLELFFPMPLVKDRSRVRSAFFVDAGNVFSSYCTAVQELANNCNKFEFGEFRYSVGISLSWFSGAFGIMTFSLAKPFNNSIIDETEIFQFNIGNTF